MAPCSTSQLFVHRTSCSLCSILRRVSLHRPSHTLVSQQLRGSSANCQPPHKRFAKVDFVECLAAGCCSLGARKGTVGQCCSLILATEHYLGLLFLRFPNAKENAKLDEIAPGSTSQLFFPRTSCSLCSILRSVSLRFCRFAIITDPHSPPWNTPPLAGKARIDLACIRHHFK